jgi:hypothetical protein
MDTYEDARADAVAFIERTRKSASRFAARGTPEAKEKARLLRWRSTRMGTTLRNLDEHIAKGRAS